jgi:hypothetical protein
LSAGGSAEAAEGGGEVTLREIEEQMALEQRRLRAPEIALLDAQGIAALRASVEANMRALLRLRQAERRALAKAER